MKRTLEKIRGFSFWVVDFLKGGAVIKNFLKVYPPLAGDYPCLPAGPRQAIGELLRLNQYKDIKEILENYNTPKSNKKRAQYLTGILNRPSVSGSLKPISSSGTE